MADQVAVALQTVPEPLYWGETAAYWCQTGLLLLTAILAGLAIVSARRIERRKTAVLAIFESRHDRELIKGLRRIAVLHDDPNANMRNFGRKAQKDHEDAQLIRYVLNHYEYVSVGIQEGIYDELIFKNSICGIVVSLYDRTKPFIEMVREEEKRRTVFQEFEWLACRWKDSPLSVKKIKGVV
jgi:hypothetical protein